MNFNGKDASEKWNDISRMLLQVIDRHNFSVKEVRFLKNVRHPNIVEYKACFLKGQTCWVDCRDCPQQNNSNLDGDGILPWLSF